jgi:hypothetical protein
MQEFRTDAVVEACAASHLLHIRANLLRGVAKAAQQFPLYGTVELKSPFSDRLALLEDGTLMQLVDDNIEFRADARVPKAQFS